MGLDLRPMGKPKPGFEKRYEEIFKMIAEDKIPKASIIDKIKGKRYPTREELLKEWFLIQIPSYETIKAPKVGRDNEADIWIRQKYEELEQKPPIDEFLKDYEGYYVIELAKELDGVPTYISIGQDKNVFRGQFLNDCTDLIGKELVDEAWNSKLASEALDYGNRLMRVADQIAKKNRIEYLKNQRTPPEKSEDSIEWKLHIVFSIAKWLIFYGQNGHGYEANF